MSLDEALYDLVGAALVVCAEGLDLEVPARAIASGDAFIGFLSQRGAWGEANRIVEETKRDAWLDRDTRGIALQVTESHARALSRGLDEFRPERRVLKDVLLGPERSQSRGQRVALQVVQAARQADWFATLGLRDDVAYLLLDRVFGRLLHNPGYIIGLQAVYREYFESAFPGPIASSAGTAPNDVAPSESFEHVTVYPPAAPARAARPRHQPSSPSIGSSIGSSTGLPAAAPALKSEAGRLEVFGLGAACAAQLAAGGKVDRLFQVKSRQNLGDGVFQRFLGYLERQATKEAEFVGRLQGMAAWLNKLRDTLTQPSNEDAGIRRLKTEAAAALSLGDFERAMQLLKQVRRGIREDRRRIEARLREDITNLNAQMVDEAAATARLAEIELARRDYAAAAELFLEARDALPHTARDETWSYTMRQAEALFRHGDEFGDNAALLEASRIYTAALKTASRTGMPEQWAAAQTGHADTLAAIGERLEDPAQLLAAAAAYREAMSALDRRGAPRQWAMVSLNLGSVLVRLGHYGDRQKHWIDAASSITSAVEAFEADGAADDAEIARRNLAGLRQASAGG